MADDGDDVAQAGGGENLDPDTFEGQEGMQKLDRLCRAWATSRSSDDLEPIESLLLVRANRTYEKHEVPRIATAALVSVGPVGVRALVSLLPSMPGHIYPHVAIRTLWLVAAGHVIPESVLGIQYEPYNIDAKTRVATRIALEDLIIEAEENPELSRLVISLAHADSIVETPGAARSSFTSYLLQTWKESSIVLTAKLIEEFASLLSHPHPERRYQEFLAANPVFLDPLAAEVLPHHRLGTEYVTDYIVRRHDNRYVAVEIERPTDPIFTTSRDFTAKFNHAAGQVLDFQGWVAENVAYAQQKLPLIESPQGLLIMGMRSSLSSAEEAKLRRWSSNSRSIDFLTFDDLLGRAGELYRSLRRIDQERSGNP